MLYWTNCHLFSWHLDILWVFILWHCHFINFIDFFWLLKFCPFMPFGQFAVANVAVWPVSPADVYQFVSCVLEWYHHGVWCLFSIACVEEAKVADFNQIKSAHHFPVILANALAYCVCSPAPKFNSWVNYNYLAIFSVHQVYWYFPPPCIFLILRRFVQESKSQTNNQNVIKA